MTALLYRQLADKLKRAIDHGSLKSGDRLPSVRELSEREQVSLATAVTTYRHLENQGLVEARPKSGFFVREQAHRLAEPEMQRTSARAKTVTVVDTIMQVISAGRHAGTPTGMHVFSSEQAELRIGQGMQFVAVSSDLGMLASNVRSLGEALGLTAQAGIAKY